MPLTGQTATPETRAKISEALKAFRARTQPRRKKHTGGRQKKVPKLPHSHPLAADIDLHETLCRTGISWLACDQMRDLRKHGVSLAAIGAFYGVPSTTVALVSSWTDLSKIVIEEGDINRPLPRRLRHPANDVHFGRSYETGNA